MGATDDTTYRAVLNAVPVGIAILSRDGEFRRTNQQFCEMVGYSADELSRKSFADLLHTGDAGDVFQFKGMEHGQPVPSSILHARLLHRSGAVVQTEVKLRQVVPEAGDPVVVAAVEDVTERERQEEMAAVLAAQSRRLSSIISRSPFFTAIVDGGGRITYLNDAGLELLGVDAVVFSELGGLDIAEAAPLDSGGGPLIEAVKRGGSWLGECGFRQTVGGKEIPMEVCAFSISDSGGAEGGTAVVAYDITKRRQFQEQVDGKNRTLALLARQLLTAQEDERAAIARELHDDITQDLSFIAMELGMLQADEGVSERVARSIRESYEKLGDLAEKVRKLSHQYHPSVLNHSDLNGALRSLCSEFGEMHGIEVQFRTTGDVSSCPSATGIVLYRIAQESLRNAVKHAHADRIEVAVEASGKDVQVAVIDNGVGFDSDSAQDAGGLGLQSMRERAETVGATTNIRSEPGQGTRVEVRAPLPESSATNPDPAPSSAS